MQVNRGLLDWNGIELCFRRVLYLITGFIFFFYFHALRMIFAHFSPNIMENKTKQLLFILDIL